MGRALASPQKANQVASFSRRQSSGWRWARTTALSRAAGSSEGSFSAASEMASNSWVRWRSASVISACLLVKCWITVPLATPATAAMSAMVVSTMPLRLMHWNTASMSRRRRWAFADWRLRRIFFGALAAMIERRPRLLFHRRFFLSGLFGPESGRAQFSFVEDDREAAPVLDEVI